MSSVNGDHVRPIPVLMMVAVAAVALAARAAFASVYGIAAFRDSEDYLLLAQQFAAMDLRDNNGWRTPVYPLLVLLAAGDFAVIAFMQALMGAAASVLLFVMLFRATGSLPAGLIGALAQALAVNQLALEASVLAETTATVFVVGAVYAADRAWRQDWSLGWIAFAALLSSLATLSRPQYITLLPAIVLLVLCRAPTRRPRAAAAFVAVFALPLLAWMSIQSVTIGSFSITTLLGYNLTTHVSRIVERAPDEFSVIRESFVEHRRKVAAAGGAEAMTIFSAKADIEQRTGLDAVTLSRELARMSVALIRSDPLQYGSSVGRAWIHYFAFPVTMLKQDHFADVSAWRLVDGVDRLQRWAFRFMYLVFLIAAVPLVHVGLWRRRGSDRMLNTGVLCALVVLLTSVLQALLQFGGNGRFALPTQSLAVAAVIVCAVGMRNHLRGARIG